MPEQTIWHEVPSENLPGPDWEYDRDSDAFIPVSTDEVETELASSMKIPVSSDRPARMVSCEQEIGSGGHWIAAKLNRSGLSRYSGMVPYHCSEPGESFCSVEEDASVNAEIIYSKLRLDQNGIALRFGQALNLVKNGIISDEVSVDSRCGFHIHIGVGNDGRNKCYSMDSVESLYHLGNFLEDFLFRIGSANWPWHRSEAPNAGPYWDYARPVPKGLKGKAQIGQGMSRHHHNAMSFSHFFASRDYCRCGAFVFSDWSECQCTNLPKPTVEFRIFNGTANQKKIRAYISLCLAMVSFAEKIRLDDTSLPVYPWQGTGDLIPSQSKETLDWVLNHLYLTDTEKSDLLYCCEKSSLQAVL